jgi:putative two-component system response regulator
MDKSDCLLIIDDDKALLLGLAETVKREGWQVMTADNGNLGIQLAEDHLPHLIVCDMMMPAPNGLAVLQSLSKNPATAGIPFIFLTARAGENDKINGFNLGADDFITKPFSKDELLGRIRAILRRKKITESREQIKIKETISFLNNKIDDLIQISSLDQSELAKAMSQMLSLRDNETEEHSRRVLELTDRLACELGMEKQTLEHLRLGALLHDIGKVGIPDSILLKPGTLTNEERKVMMTHPAIGKRILKPLGLPSAAMDLVYHHHERWDGSGYPDGLAGEKIPLPARIFAIVDVWDAITSDRPYRPAWDTDKAIRYISEQAGMSFDPLLVEKFLILIQLESKGR